MYALIKKNWVAIAMASVISMPVSATNIVVTANNQWQTFDVDNSLSQSNGLEWIDAQSAADYNNDGSKLDFVFTLATAEFLTVVDAGFAGDQFQVFDNGVLLGLTSSPTNSYPNSVGTSFDAALANSQYSRGVFYLSAGQHDISGLLVLSANDSTGSAINATVGAIELSAVPEPTYIEMFLVGGMLLRAYSQRRSH
jgi:hypothetical protein